MKKSWKRLLVFLTIPFIALVLTACPGNGEADDPDAPAVEESVEDAVERLGEFGQDAADAVEDVGDGLEDAAGE